MRQGHAEYIAECDEDQLRNLIEQASARIEKIQQSGWVKLWTVSVGWSNVAWFAESNHGAAIDYGCRAVRAEAVKGPGKGVEMEVKLERYRPEEVAELLAAKEAA